MSSILTNSAALSALQSLNMVQQALQTTQNQVSSGLAVASAKDNASYWSIGQQLQADSGIATAANTALAQSQSVFDTASSAIASVITTINSIQTTLTQASNPGANYNNINTTLAALSSQLSDAISGASFNGTNLLNGSQTSALNFVSGYNSSSGSVTQIGFTAQALTGGQAASSTVTTQLANVSDTTMITKLNAMITAGSNGVTTASYLNNAVVVTAGSGTTPTTISITSVDEAGVSTNTTYSAIDANGNAYNAGAAASGFTVSQTVVTPSNASTSLLSQTGTGSNVYNLSNLGTGGTVASATNAADMLASVNNALSAVTNYAAKIGATQDRMTAMSNFNTALTTDLANGVSALVDANMNTASTRLQALQTQQQLGIQSLSIANQNSQLILKLFG